MIASLAMHLVLTSWQLLWRFLNPLSDTAGSESGNLCYFVSNDNVAGKFNAVTGSRSGPRAKGASDCPLKSVSNQQ